MLIIVNGSAVRMIAGADLYAERQPIETLGQKSTFIRDRRATPRPRRTRDLNGKDIGKIVTLILIAECARMIFPRGWRAPSRHGVGAPERRLQRDLALVTRGEHRRRAVHTRVIT
jgi:hypothetical protein